MAKHCQVLHLYYLLLQRLGDATADDIESQSDNPPSYEDAIKSEAPPPPYYMVVPETHTPSTSTHPSHTKTHSMKTTAAYTNGMILGLPSVTRTQEGITSPFLNHITSSEGFRTSTTAPALPQDPCTSTPSPPQGPVDVIRAPILREARRVLAPTHLSSPASHANPGLP